MRIIYALAIVLSLWCGAIVWGAPVPLLKRETWTRPAPLMPVCDMTWGATTWRTEFRGDTSYEAINEFSRYVGRWHLLGRVLTITERHIAHAAECPDSWHVYEITLGECMRAGKVNGWCAFSLADVSHEVTD